MTIATRFPAALFALCLTISASAAAQNSDQALGLVGVWKCESAAGSVGTATFTSDAPGSISMKNTYRTTAGTSGEFDETFHFDAGAGTWTWSSTLRSAPDFKESGTAGRWTADTWIFEGTLQQSQSTEPVRMIYTRLGENTIRREFEAQVSGAWLTRSSSSCARSSAVATNTNTGDLQKKMAAAAKNIKSFRFQLSSPMGMTSASTVIVHPMLMHMQIAGGPIVMEMYVAEGYMYRRIGSGAWQKQAIPSMASLPTDAIKRLAEGTSMTLGADVSDGGVTYGSYDVSVPTASVPGAPAAQPMMMSCTYDKSTFLTHECKNSFFTETFLDYNGPDNVVTLPAELSTATESPGITTPAMPSPSSTPK